MSLYPHAVQEPIGYDGGPLTATTVIVHSEAGHDDDPIGTLQAEHLSAHFQVASDGTVRQYVDTSRIAWANVNANAFAISIETENTEGFGTLPQFDLDAWNPVQYTALLRLIDWCCTTHGIARTPVTAESGGGIGFHEQFATWTTPGHRCPGWGRVHQLQHDLIPALIPQPKGPFMALTDAQQTELLQRVRDLTADDPATSSKFTPGLLARVDHRTANLRDKLDAITGVVSSVSAALKIKR